MHAFAAGQLSRRAALSCAGDRRYRARVPEPASPCCRWRYCARHAPPTRCRSYVARQHQRAPLATNRWRPDELAGCARSARARTLGVAWPSTSPRSIAAMMLLSLQTLSSTLRLSGGSHRTVGCRGRCLMVTYSCRPAPPSEVLRIRTWDALVYAYSHRRGVGCSPPQRTALLRTMVASP